MVQLKKGQILNFKPKYSKPYHLFIVLNNIIKYGRPGFVHSAIIKDANPLQGICLVTEAVDKGFTTVNYGYVNMLTKVLNEEVALGKTNERLIDVDKVIEKYEGTKYAWWDIISIGVFTVLNLLTRILTFRKYKNLVNTLYKITPDTKKMICSEAVVKVLYDASDRKVDFQKEYDKTYSQIEPMDIARSNQIKWYNPNKKNE